jgi:hypothetical protein
MIWQGSILLSPDPSRRAATSGRELRLLGAMRQRPGMFGLSPILLLSTGRTQRRVGTSQLEIRCSNTSFTQVAIDLFD